MGFFKVLAIGMAVFFGLGVKADPPTSPKNHWRNHNDPKHYILYESSSATWVETVNCTAMWRFKKISSDLNNLYLRDEGRKLTVRINYDDMQLKFDNEPAFHFYQKGTFDKRVRFFHQYNGQWTGTLSRLNGCAWEERLAGDAKPAWFFKAYGEDANSVYLYDGSRNMRVRLDAANMYLQPSGQANFSLFKGGYWSEN